MQSFYAITLALLPLLSPVLGAPTADAGIVARTPGNVYMCTGTDWSGTCETKSLGTDGTCYELEKPWYESIGSAGPDKGAICRIFDNNSCTGSGLSIMYYPGKTNLYNDIDAGHRAQYISCHLCTNCQ